MGKKQNFLVKITRCPVSGTWLSQVLFEEQSSHTDNIPSSHESMLFTTKPQRNADRYLSVAVWVGHCDDVIMM